MDPNAAWNGMLGALMDGMIGEAKEYAEALLGWLDRGGFMPKATQVNMSRDDVYAVVRFVLSLGGA